MDRAPRGGHDGRADARGPGARRGPTERPCTALARARDSRRSGLGDACRIALMSSRPSSRGRGRPPRAHARASRRGATPTPTAHGAAHTESQTRCAPPPDLPPSHARSRQRHRPDPAPRRQTREGTTWLMNMMAMPMARMATPCPRHATCTWPGAARRQGGGGSRAARGEGGRAASPVALAVAGRVHTGPAARTPQQKIVFTAQNIGYRSSSTSITTQNTLHVHTATALHTGLHILARTRLDSDSKTRPSPSSTITRDDPAQPFRRHSFHRRLLRTVADPTADPTAI